MGKVIASITTSVDGYVTGPRRRARVRPGPGWRAPALLGDGRAVDLRGRPRLRHARPRQGVLRRARLDGGVRGRRPRHYDAAGARAGPTRSPGPCSCSPTAPRTSRGRDRFRFVADLDAALAQAAEAARDGDVAVGGGADVIRQAWRRERSTSWSSRRLR